MTYPSSPTNPLADKRWRRRHSLWLLAVYLGVGIFSWIGFIYCAIRVRTRRWWIRAAATAAAGVVSVALMEIFTDSVTNPDGTTTSVDAPGPADDVANLFLVASWIAMIVYGHVVNREYLRWRASVTGAGAWYNQSPSTPASVVPPHAFTANPLEASATAIGDGARAEMSAYFAVPPPVAHTSPSLAPAPRTSDFPSQRLVDINTADATTIAAAASIDAGSAARIVAARAQHGGFHGFDDVTVRAGLQPHELVKLQRIARFSAPSSGEGPAAPISGPSGPTSLPPGGRILDY